MSPSRWLAACAAAVVVVAAATGLITLDQAEQALVWLARIAGAAP